MIGHWLLAVLLGLLGLIGALVAGTLSRLAADETKAWLPKVTESLIDRAVQNLPIDLQDRFAEEWRSHVMEVPGELSKLLVAIGIMRASWQLFSDTHRRPGTATKKRSKTDEYQLGDLVFQRAQEVWKLARNADLALAAVTDAARDLAQETGTALDRTTLEVVRRAIAQVVQEELEALYKDN